MAHTHEAPLPAAQLSTGMAMLAVGSVSSKLDLQTSFSRPLTPTPTRRVLENNHSQRAGCAARTGLYLLGLGKQF